jgi:hypothetical protein
MCEVFVQKLKAVENQRVPVARVAPEPLVPAHVNLATYPWAPVRMDFFTGHLLALAASAEPFRALVLLMAQAWRQKPAMTLPDNDIQLASMAGFGRDVLGWVDIRPEALADWFLAADGRLHHPEFATWAMQASASKEKTDRSSEKQRERALAGVARRQAAALAESPSVVGHGPAAAQPYENTEESEQNVDEQTHERESIPSLEGRQLPTAFVNSSFIASHATTTKEGGQPVGGVDPVVLIFEHWKQKTGRPDVPLLESRKSVIQARLNEGISVEQICLAIDHAAQDDFYQGRTVKSTRRLDTLEVICKTSDRILGMASENSASTQLSKLKLAAQRTAENARAAAAQMQADVIDAEEPSVLAVVRSAA